MLNRDILYEIMLHIDVEDMINMCKVNQSTYRIGQNEKFWEKKLLTEFSHFATNAKLKDIYTEHELKVIERYYNNKDVEPEVLSNKEKYIRIAKKVSLFRQWLNRDRLFYEWMREIATILKIKGYSYFDEHNDQMTSFKIINICHRYNSDGTLKITGNKKNYTAIHPIAWCHPGNLLVVCKNPLYIKSDEMLALTTCATGVNLEPESNLQLLNNQIVIQPYFGAQTEYTISFTIDQFCTEILKNDNKNG